MKATVLYHSVSNNTKNMADIIVEGMHRVDGVEAKSFSIDDIDEEWINESKCIIIGTPVYMATMSAEMKTWLDGPRKKYNFNGKIGGAYATANYIHGGSEIAIQSILTHMMVMGMLTYSGGGAFGVPVIHLGPVAIGGKLDESKDTFLIYGERMANKTKEIFS